MKITGYGFKLLKNCGPDSKVPLVPDGVVLDDGHVVDRNGQSLSVLRNEVLFRYFKEALDLPSPGWIGIESDGTVRVLNPDEEKEWRAEQAKKAVEEANSIAKTEALQAVALLHAGAALVGLTIQNMIHGLAQARLYPSESLEEVFQRIRKRG